MISIYVHQSIREIQLHFISQGMDHRPARYLARKVCTPVRQLERQLASSQDRAERIKRKANTLHTKYKLPLKHFEEMLNIQQHKCVICETPITIHPNPFHWQRRCVVDHCHTTGEVRGLLCSQCNTALGLLQDDPTALERAIQYLNFYK